MIDPQLVEIPAPTINLPPTQYELPCDDGIPMETGRHKLQMDLLIDSLGYWIEQRADGYVSGNMFLYFSMAQVRNQDFRGPDVFVVLDVPKGERRSWVVWEEGKAPDVVIELLSESTAQRDKTEKKLIYQNQVRVPEYFWYDPFNPQDFAGFSLTSGGYMPIQPDQQGNFFSQQLGLSLVRWQGTYREASTTWLRWATLEGNILPTSPERAQVAEQQAQAAQQQAQAAQERAQTLESLLDRYQAQFGELPEANGR